MIVENIKDYYFEIYGFHGNCKKFTMDFVENSAGS